MADFSRSPGQGFISLQWESAGHQEADVAKTVSGHFWTLVTCSVSASHIIILAPVTTLRIMGHGEEIKAAFPHLRKLYLSSTPCLRDAKPMVKL